MPTLTKQELTVLALLAQGKSDKEIAITLDIALKTVWVHVHHILAKLQVINRTQAALLYQDFLQSLQDLHE
jgi:NarL family two-component system response regulator LiaR